MTNNSPNPRNKCVALIPQGNLVHWTCSQSTINHSNVVNQFHRSSKTLCFKGSSDHHMSAFGVKQDGFATPVASFPPKYSPNNGMDGYGWMTCFDLFLRDPGIQTSALDIIGSCNSIRTFQMAKNGRIAV